MKLLDFIVFGVPRSGTTALAQYLSAVPPVHCGVEVFPTFLDHGTLDIPQAFIRCDHPQWKPSSAEAVTANRDRIRYYGNKTPTYFYRLPALLAELGMCPAICCLRPLPPVMASYSKRAVADSDPWPAGRHGLYAAGDAILLLHALSAVPSGLPVMLVPHAALRADWRAVMDRVLGHIAPGVVPEYDPDVLARLDQVRTKTEAQARPPRDPVEDQALARLNRDGALTFFNQSEVVMLDDVRDMLAAVLAGLPPNPLNFVRRLAVQHTDPEARAYFETWRKPAGRAWNVYRPLAA